MKAEIILKYFYFARNRGIGAS